MSRLAPIRRFLAALWRPIPKAARAVDDIAVDVGTAFVDGFTGAIKMVVVGAASGWRFVRENAKKLIPSRGARWTFIYVPGFVVALMFALQTFGLIDMRDYVLEVGAKSSPVVIAAAFAMLLSHVLGWNLDNEARAYYQRVLLGCTFPDEPLGYPAGAFKVLAGETFGFLALFASILAAMLVFQ